MDILLTLNFWICFITPSLLFFFLLFIFSLLLFFLFSLFSFFLFLSKVLRYYPLVSFFSLIFFFYAFSFFCVVCFILLFIFLYGFVSELRVTLVLLNIVLVFFLCWFLCCSIVFFVFMLLSSLLLNRAKQRNVKTIWQKWTILIRPTTTYLNQQYSQLHTDENKMLKAKQNMEALSQNVVGPSKTPHHKFQKTHEIAGNSCFSFEIQTRTQYSHLAMGLHMPRFHKERPQRKKRKEIKDRKQKKKKDSNKGRNIY